MSFLGSLAFSSTIYQASRRHGLFLLYKRFSFSSCSHVLSLLLLRQANILTLIPFRFFTPTTTVAQSSHTPETPKTTTSTGPATTNPQITVSWAPTRTTTPYCSTLTTTLTTGCPTFVPLGCPTPRTCNDTLNHTIRCGCASNIPVITRTVQCPNGCEDRKCTTLHNTIFECPGETISYSADTSTVTSSSTPTSSQSPWQLCPTYTSSVWRPLTSSSRQLLTTATKGPITCDVWTHIDVPCGCTVATSFQYVTAQWSCATQYRQQSPTGCGTNSITTTPTAISSATSMSMPAILKPFSIDISLECSLKSIGQIPNALSASLLNHVKANSNVYSNNHIYHEDAI